ncbi:hypothetical protein [Chitinilyticum aquatile]|nr:hypothetical protein [Chitinilyticum aquatile]
MVIGTADAQRAAERNLNLATGMLDANDFKTNGLAIQGLGDEITRL